MIQFRKKYKKGENEQNCSFLILNFKKRERENGEEKKKREKREKEERREKRERFLFSDIHSAATETLVYLLHPPLDRAEIWTECLGHLVIHSDRSDRPYKT